MQQLLQANGQTQLQVARLESIQGNARWDGDNSTHCGLQSLKDIAQEKKAMTAETVESPLA
jgi:hypothetical protein